MLKMLSALVLLIHLLISQDVLHAEAKLCETPSKLFRGVCLIDSNCAKICEKEGYLTGNCKGFRFRCICAKECGGGDVPAPKPPFTPCPNPPGGCPTPPGACPNPPYTPKPPGGCPSTPPNPPNIPKPPSDHPKPPNPPIVPKPPGGYPTPPDIPKPIPNPPNIPKPPGGCPKPPPCVCPKPPTPPGGCPNPIHGYAKPPVT